MNQSAHSDIVTGDWIDRRLPAWARPYARLMRLDRPIGTWLLLWPCLWGVTLASGRVPHVWSMALFVLGALVMRGAGCAINDIYDRDIDPLVERTRTRPLASGQLRLWQAAVFTVVLMFVGLGVLLMFNTYTVWLGIASLVLVFTYPLAKRFTWWPQLVLGLAFNWGALMGWSAVRGQLDPPALCLYIGGIFWTLGYDTIYAHQDKRDDIMIGVKSLALYLGDRSRGWIAGFYALSIVFIALAGFMADRGIGFVVILAAAIAQATWQLVTWHPSDPANCLQRFRSNSLFGFLVFVALWVGTFV